MHYGQIITNDCANGTGIRLSLFVSGCTNQCPGCFQPETWDFEYGLPYTEETQQNIISELKKPQYTGITILGGEPFELENQKTILDLINTIKTQMPEKTIWMYTGFIYDRDLIKGGKRYIEHITPNIINQIDTLVDGPFIKAQKNIQLQFRGSNNQRIIHFKNN